MIEPIVPKNIDWSDDKEENNDENNSGNFFFFFIEFWLKFVLNKQSCL